MGNDDKGNNPVGIKGFAFIEFAAEKPFELSTLFRQLGFSRAFSHNEKSISVYTQGGIQFFLNSEPQTFASRFVESHGPSIPSMGWWVEDAVSARKVAVSRGARPAEGDYSFPSVFGIGDSLISFVDRTASLGREGFNPLEKQGAGLGFEAIDHLTNNVPSGSLKEWAAFYTDIFGFTQIRYFDIKGKKTGLQSFALRSPCGSFAIPINEGTEEKSQINEYLREYRGAGVQHVALSTGDLLGSLRKLRETPVKLLDIDPGYYDEAFRRVPGIVEDKRAIQELGILVDGDENGYLLQIFSRNVIGPIFFEFIQRKNHASFGEGNFGALFRSIERDQEKRGVL